MRSQAAWCCGSGPGLRKLVDLGSQARLDLIFLYNLDRGRRLAKLSSAASTRGRSPRRPDGQVRELPSSSSGGRAAQGRELAEPGRWRRPAERRPAKAKHEDEVRGRPDPREGLRGARAKRRAPRARIAGKFGPTQPHDIHVLHTQNEAKIDPDFTQFLLIFTHTLHLANIHKHTNYKH